MVQVVDHRTHLATIHRHHHLLLLPVVVVGVLVVVYRHRLHRHRLHRHRLHRRVNNTDPIMPQYEGTYTVTTITAYL